MSQWIPGLVSGLLCLSLGVSAQAQSPASTASLSGPSVLKTTEPAVLKGHGLPAGAAVTVFVAAPGGQTAGYSAVVDGNGQLSYRLVASLPGSYRVTVADTGGRALAQATVNFAQ
ncbi:hypothetical protein PEC18_20290 [Paucibacter sp. O1-1]|nr:hypothetical protein [Paucibacter sp. O1-1]MDA3828091.1 hypothetical protein [Paucibacter sp. O1-1]